MTVNISLNQRFKRVVLKQIFLKHILLVRDCDSLTTSLEPANVWTE
jgi:hypothetical protein